MRQAIAAKTNGGRLVALSHRDFRSLQHSLQTFSGVAGSGFVGVTLGRGAAARRVTAELVTGNYFELLGIRPQQLQRWQDYGGTIAEQLPTLAAMSVGPASSVAPPRCSRRTASNSRTARTRFSS